MQSMQQLQVPSSRSSSCERQSSVPEGTMQLCVPTKRTACFSILGQHMASLQLVDCSDKHPALGARAISCDPYK